MYKKVCLGDLADIITGPFGSQLHASDYVEQGIPSIMPQDIGDRIVIHDRIAHITEQDAERLKKYRVEIGDIVYSRRGNIERCALISENDAGALCGTGCLRIRPDKMLVNAVFLSFYLSTPHIRKWIVDNATGATMPNLNSAILKKLPVELPDLKEQYRIANELQAIDDKIKNNSKLITTLESMAKTLYDYWCVQFDFPDVNGRPYKTSGGKMEWNETLSREIPAGWEVSTIGRHVEVDRGISYSSADLEGEGIPMVNLNSFNTDASYKVEGLKTYSGKYAKDKVIKPYDLMICTTQQTAIDLTGQTNIIGKAMILPDCFEGREVVASMDLVRLHCDDIYGKYYLRLLLAKDYFHKYVTGYAIGTKIKHLHLDGLLNYYCEVPPNSLLQSFNKKMQGIEMKKSEIINENQRLCYLRDFLLPMLMNGQVTFRQ